jgi:6-phosphofructokinase
MLLKFHIYQKESQRAIASADVEANACEYGVGLVKLMGRHAGFIALYASLANRDVNICLVPEFQFELGGPRGLLAFIVRRLKIKRHCIIVVAEGASNSISYHI